MSSGTDVFAQLIGVWRVQLNAQEPNERGNAAIPISPCTAVVIRARAPSIGYLDGAQTLVIFAVSESRGGVGNRRVPRNALPAFG